MPNHLRHRLSGHLPASSLRTRFLPSPNTHLLALAVLLPLFFGCILSATSNVYALDIVWNGQETDIWDKNTTSNWLHNSSATTFVDSDSVTFNKAAGSYLITINPAGGSFPGAMRVTGMTVAGGADFTITGPIYSTDNLTKNNGGTLTFGANSANVFQNVFLNEGTLVLNTGALTTTATGTPMTLSMGGGGTATLEFNTSDASDSRTSVPSNTL
jgi:hypothetical protein